MEFARNPAGVSGEEYRKVETVLSKKGYCFVRRMVRKPAGHITLEDFVPGDTITHVFYHTEAHYIISGEAEITYSMPPFHQKEEKLIARAGDTYLMYCGERVTWKIISDVPYRHIGIMMPCPPVPSGESLIESLYEEFNQRLFQTFKDRKPGD
jgi:hypothetical protein